MISEKFEALAARYEELSDALAQNEIILDVPRCQSILKEKAQLEPAISAWRAYQTLLSNIAQAKEMEQDEDMREMAQEELKSLLPQREQAEKDLRLYLLPRDKNDERNVIIEVRPGAGGDEAALFAGLLVRMYTRFAERHGFKVEPVDMTETELGGVKEAVFSLAGAGAFARMKYESGVHRIQRVPVTETAGRIHTSTATVAVLPEAEDVEIAIKTEDIRIDTYRASGHGGQYINRTDSAVRITHLPTGLVVTCQDEKSQLKNKEKAMKVLRARLYDLLQGQQDEKYAEFRRSQVGTGERNERIRTYNFREGRVTDHRVGLTLYRLPEIMDGDLDEIIDALAMKEQTEKLEKLRNC